jgi:hypothetical protein
VSVFVLKDPETLVALQPAEFAREDDFQQLLAKFPSLLSGGQAESADGVRPNRRSKAEESGWSFNKRNGRCQAGGDNHVEAAARVHDRGQKAADQGKNRRRRGVDSYSNPSKELT